MLPFTYSGCPGPAVVASGCLLDRQGHHCHQGHRGQQAGGREARGPAHPALAPLARPRVLPCREGHTPHPSIHPSKPNSIHQKQIKWNIRHNLLQQQKTQVRKFSSVKGLVGGGAPNFPQPIHGGKGVRLGF